MPSPVVFPFEPNWDGLFSEKIEYLTQILSSYVKNEQRYATRKFPRPVLRFKILTRSAQEDATLDALLWANRATLYAVPFWPDQQVLATQVNVGATSIPVSTQYMKFAIGGMAILWRDYKTFEVVTISAMSSSTLTVSATINQWLADGKTRVVPILNGRMTDSFSLQHETSIYSHLELQFACEVV